MPSRFAVGAGHRARFGAEEGMKRMFMLNRLAVLAGTCFVLVCSQTALAGEDTTYKEQALRLISGSKEIFLRKGICSEKTRDCLRKELVLGTGTPSGIALEYYEIDPVTVNEILGLCLAEYERNNRRISISIHAYRQPHRDRVNKLFSVHTPKPYIEVTIKGEK